MNRRRVLLATASTLSVPLTGCLGEDDDEDGRDAVASDDQDPPDTESDPHAEATDGDNGPGNETDYGELSGYMESSCRDC